MSPTRHRWTAAMGTQPFACTVPIEQLKTGRPKDGVMSFEGYASVFNTPIDAYVPTVIEPGAFAATLANPEHRRRMRLLYGHNPDHVIGRLTEVREDRRGLFVKAALSDTPMGRDVHTLLKDGALDEMSIGFDAAEYFMTREPGESADTRHLTAVHLWEVSIVAFAANREARVASVHRRGSALRTRHDIAAQLRELDLRCLEAGLIPPGDR